MCSFFYFYQYSNNQSTSHLHFYTRLRKRVNTHTPRYACDKHRCASKRVYTQYPYIYIVYVYKYGECSQVVRQWIVVPSFAGSNPVIRPSYVCNALSYVRLSLTAISLTAISSTAISLTPISAKTPLTKPQNIHIFMYMCSSKYKLASESIPSVRHKCSVLARQTYFHFVRSTHVQSSKPPSSRGQGHFLFAEETRVRVPLGVNKKGVIAQLVERVAYTDNVSGSNPFYPIYDTLGACLSYL